MNKSIFVRSVMLLLLACSSWVQAATVGSVRLWPAPDHVRLVFDVSGPVDYQVFDLTGPHRLVIDIRNAQLATDLTKLDLKNTSIRKVRSGVRNGKDLRVVLDLERAIPNRSFLLTPNGQYGDRLVVDLLTGEAAGSKPQEPPRVVRSASDARNMQRDIIVVVDAGHGGEDPGAIGPNRLREKDVVLGISRELHRLLNQEQGFASHLTRDGDYYISLRQRTQLARKHNADLFVSIHADAFTRPEASGASVYAISERGATSETARWLAERENRSDLIGGVGGVSLDDKDNALAGVLLDLSMTASLNASLSAGNQVLRSMGAIAKLHKPRVEQAAFVVLKSPDIPSLLVETGFISNPTEARLLANKDYQRKMARAIFQGIKSYFEDAPPPGTYLAWKKHGGTTIMASAQPAQLEGQTIQYVITRGDTLSSIAKRNNISVMRLREVNGLSSDQLRIGQVIQIPSS